MIDIDKRMLTMTRNFDAPRSLVWDAWTQPEHIAHWWAPPGMKTDIIKHEFKVGGDWEYSMKMPDGRNFKAFGTYQRIEAPDLLETTANFLPMTEGVTLIAEFKDAGDKTEFTFRVVHPTEEYCKQQAEMGFYNGWATVFEGLNGYLQEI